MAPSVSSPEKEERRPPHQYLKARSALQNRDKPLFASRRQQKQHPEFLTDSILDPSSIPSPSPPKNGNNAGAGARPRRTIPRKTLAEAFRATPNVTDENRPPSSASVSSRKSTQSHIRPPSSQVSRPTTRPSSRQTEPRTRDTTPSPIRERQASIVSPLSPESASSPPHGLAESYQRIVDEENLAAQEDDSIDGLTGYNIEEMDHESLRHSDKLRLQRIQDSASPISLRVSRRATPNAAIGEIAAAEEETKEDEKSAQSSEDTVGSLLNSITEESFRDLPSQRAKDEQRKKGALRSDAQVFRKARIGDKVGLTVENLRRKTGSSESLRNALGGGSISSKGSDPPLNYPQGWGRKAKPGKDWLNRINNRSGKFTGDSPRHSSSEVAVDTEPQKPDSKDQIEDWIATTSDVPLPSVENGSPQATMNFSTSIPTAASLRRSSLDRILEWNDDFTARSLQVSDSPPIQIKSANLERLHEREIKTLEKRAVTTSRLGELREKRSEEYLVRRASIVSNEDPKSVEEYDSKRSPEKKRSSHGSPLKPRRRKDSEDQSVIDDEGNAIPDSLVVVFKAKPETAGPNDKETSVSDDKIVNPPRPSHKRQDSRDVLRKLARATSASPSPHKPESKEIHDSGNGLRNPTAAEETTPKSMHRPQVPQAEDSAGKGPTQDVDSDRQPDASRSAEETPKPFRSSTHLKTPLVTGAWIDTPLPTGGRGPPMPTPNTLEIDDTISPMDQEIRKLASANLIREMKASPPQSKQAQSTAKTPHSHPKSALEAIICAAKGNNDAQGQTSDSEGDPPLQLGESTIQSLEDLLTSDSAPSDPPSPETSPPEQASPSNEDSPQKSRRKELSPYTHLTNRLSTLGSSLRDAKKNIASLEDLVSVPAASKSSRAFTRQSQDTGECTEGGEFHDFIWPCEQCGCRGLSAGDAAYPRWEGWGAISIPTDRITIPIPRLWRWRNGSRWPSPTWLGWATLVGWGLVVGEWGAW